MIFRRPVLDDLDRRELDRVGFRVLPGLLTDEAAGRVARSAERVEALAPDAPKARRPRRFAAEHDAFLESLIAHPQMLGLVRVFLYPTGFAADDGGLKVVPGSHRLREPDVRAESDAALRSGWLAGRRDPATGRPLAMESLSAPPGSVVLMWTHTVHGVTPRRPGGGTRWAVVYGYRNPGRPSPSRWVTPAFEARAGGGREGLLAPL